MSDPVDDFLSEKEKSAAQRDTEDMQALQVWQRRKTKRNLGTLLKRFEPVFNAKVSSWKAQAVPTAAFKADLQKNAITAFETYDPDRGAKLRTHVNNMLKRSLRFNAKYQNMAFIPEEKAALISPVQQARDHLHQEFGKKPNNRAIATFLNQNPDMLPKRVRGRVTSKLVKTVDAYQIKDIPGAAFETDPVPRAMSFEQETLDLLRPALKGDEQVVYDYMFGHGGKPKVGKTGEIAKRMGKSPSQISRLKRRIEATYKKYV